MWKGRGVEEGRRGWIEGLYVNVANLFVEGLGGNELDLYHSTSAEVLKLYCRYPQQCQLSAPPRIENISRAEACITPCQATVKVLAKQLCIFTSAAQPRLVLLFCAVTDMCCLDIAGSSIHGFVVLVVENVAKVDECIGGSDRVAHVL